MVGHEAPMLIIGSREVRHVPWAVSPVLLDVGLATYAHPALDFLGDGENSSLLNIAVTCLLSVVLHPVLTPLPDTFRILFDLLSLYTL